MTTQSSKAVVASAIGIGFCGAFTGGNFGISFIGLPCVLLSSPPSALPEPATSPNDKAPSKTSVPKPVTSSGHLARQWQYMYDLGVIAGPAVGLLGSASYLTAYYLLPAEAKIQKQLFIAAAAINMGIVPYTFAFLAKINAEISKRAKSPSSGTEEVVEAKAGDQQSLQSRQTSELIVAWSNRNVGRAMIPLVSIGCAIAALLE